MSTIAVPSFRLLFYQLNVPQGRRDREGHRQAMVLELQLSGQRKFEFDSLMVQEKDLKPGQPRLLAVDNEMVVPVNKVVRVHDHRR